MRGALQFAGIQLQPGIVGQRQLQHLRTLRGGGAGRRAMRRVGGRHQVHACSQFVARRAGNGQMAYMDRVEGAAVVEMQPGIGNRESGIGVGPGVGSRDLGVGKARV